jgi:hypothetical protein
LKDEIDDQDPDSFGEAGHLFTGYFLPFPGKSWDRKGDGFVTLSLTILHSPIGFI